MEWDRQGSCAKQYINFRNTLISSLLDLFDDFLCKKKVFLHKIFAKGFHKNEKKQKIFFSIPDQSDRECLWIIEAPKQDQIQISLDTSPSDCPATSNHIYIYDGLPSFISRDGDSQTLGVFCPTEPLSSESTHRKKVLGLFE